MASVRLCGQDLDEADLVVALRGKSEFETKLLVGQIRLDQEATTGDSVGLEQFSKAFRGMLMAFIASRFFPTDAETVQEVWNDTLLLVFTRIDQFDPDRSAFRTWVFNQARYASLNALRARARFSREVSGAHADADPSDVFELDEPRSAAERDAVREGWKRLSAGERELIRLRFGLGYEPVEVARLHYPGVNPDHVRVYINRAVSHLRRFVTEALNKPR